MAETIGRYRMCQFVAMASRMMGNVDGVSVRNMATYITSYYKSTKQWASYSQGIPGTPT